MRIISIIFLFINILWCQNPCEDLKKHLIKTQMKPENKKVELNENEKVVYNLLSDVKAILSEIKEKSALSNKAWDKSTKSLRKLGLISVEKKGDNLYIFRLK